MILNDEEIEAVVDAMDMIQPYTYEQLQPASYDVQLADIVGAVSVGDGQWIIKPKQFVLGSTIEKICLPDDLVARIEGKSSWARQGLIVHTAGFIDPGFCGTLTLEITNLSNHNISVQRGKLIAQVAFSRMTGKAKRPYGTPGLNSHYQGQNGVTPSIL